MTIAYEEGATHSDVDTVVDCKLSVNLEVRTDLWFKAGASLTNSRYHEAQNWKREQRDLVRSRFDRAGKHLKMCSDSGHGEIHISTSDDAVDLFAVIAAFENVRNQVDLLCIDLDCALRKDDLASC